MANVFELFGRVVIDGSRAEAELDKIGRNANSFANGLESKFRRVAMVVATVFTVGKIKEFGQTCVQTYADIAAAESAFEQTMGEYADSARQKMGAIADETGVVSDRLMPYMTKMTAKFQGLGYGVDEATTLATEGLRMASDSAAFWDVSLDDAMSHLNSFINGSYEGGEAIGLFANDTQMAAYAVSQGLVANTEAWSKLDEATKQATRMQYAKEMLDSAGMTGQASREADSFANVTANLTAMWQKLLATIGKPILQKMVLPIIQKLTDIMPKLSQKVEVAMETFGEWLGKVGDVFEGVFGEDGSIDFEALGEAIANMFTKLKSSIPRLLSSMRTAISNAWKNAVWPMLQSLFRVSFGVELPDWSVIADAIKFGWETYVKPILDTAFTWLNDNMDGIVAVVKATAIVFGVLWAMAHPLKTALIALGGAFVLLKTDVDESNTVLYNIKAFLVDIKKWIDENAGVINAAIAALAIALAALNWPLALIIGLVAIVIANWEGLKLIIGKVATAISDFFAITLPAWWENSVVTPIKNAWESVKTTVNNVATAVSNFFSVTIPNWWKENVTTPIVEAWNSVTSAIDAAIVSLERFLGINNGSDVHVFEGENGSVTFGGGGGSFGDETSPRPLAKGLDYVPYDEFPAFLHKGEAVLTASEAAVWRNGGGIGNTSLVEAKLDSLLGVMQQVVANTGRGQSIVLDSGVLVGQTAAQMDMQLGTMAGRKGRRN